MPLPVHTVTCLGKRTLARDIIEFRMTKPAGFTFIPGQYVLFHVPLVENPADTQTRAFSIASMSEEEDLLFVAKLVPGGRASRWIDELLGEGTEATFTGPLGRFVLHPEIDKDYLFIATSTGIAPFRSMVLHQLQKGDRRRMDVVFCVKSEEHLFWQDWLTQVAKDAPNVSAHVSLSQGSESWTGYRGRVQTVTPKIVRDDFSGKSLYVCGSPEMTKEVKQLALTEWGMEKGDVHVEGYI